MLGDVLREKAYLLADASTNKCASNAFWIILRDIAVEEIIRNERPVDSDIIIPLYYDILLENIQYIPEYFQIATPSNKQERFRVINRNLFTSNAFNPDGLANQPGIIAHQELNDNRGGRRVVFQKA